MDNSLETLDVLNKHHKLIFDIYIREGLKCLRGEKEDDNRLAGKDIYQWYFRTCSKITDINFEKLSVIDNLLFYSDEIMYFTANIFLIHPFITDPEFGKLELNGSIIYPYDPNLADKRYNMFIEIIFEKLYSYWSQIAIILKGYFIPDFKNPKFNFSMIIDELSKKELKSGNFKWLYSFKENEYTQFNKVRKNIVHSRSFDTEYRNQFLKNIHNPENLKDIILQRRNISSFFKKHIDYTLIGFEKTLDLITEHSQIQILPPSH